MSSGNGENAANIMATMATRSTVNASVVMYGGSPPLPDVPDGDGLHPWRPSPYNPPIQSPVFPGFTQPCAKCQRHVRLSEPCPFCLRDDLDTLKAALGKDAKPAETIAALKTALRKSLAALRDVSKVTGGALEPLIAECEKALDAGK